MPSDDIWSVTLDPTGRFAYVQDYYGSTLFTYSIGSGGGLTLVTSSAIQASSFISMPLLPPFVFVQNENNYTNITHLRLYYRFKRGAPTSPRGRPSQRLVITFMRWWILPLISSTIPNQNDNSLSVYSIGPSGSLTLLSTVATGNGPISVAPDPTGRYLYVTNCLDNTVSAYTVGLTGTLTPVTGSPFATGSGPETVTVDPRR